MKRIIAGILTLCMIFSAESALAFNTSIQETTIASAKPKLSVKADSVVYVGKKTELTATVSGMTGTLRGVTVRWTVNGRSVQTKKSQTIQKGKKLSLSYSIPKTTTSSSVKIAVSVKRGSRTLASKSVRIPVRYGFYGAKLTPSKTTYAIEGKNKTVSMKLTGLKSSLKGSINDIIQESDHQTQISAGAKRHGQNSAGTEECRRKGLNEISSQNTEDI